MTSRLRDLRTEARLAPGFRGLAAAMGGAVVARGAGRTWREAAGLGIASGVVQRALLRTEYRLAREIRNSADAAALAAWLGDAVPPFGAWAVEPDFARLVAIELSDRPETVVECGSGMTTLLIAAFLQRNRRGRLFSLEDDRAFAERARAQLRAAGLADVCDVIWAPLAVQSIAGQTVRWYDAARLDRLPTRIDLLVVDGPTASAPVPSSSWTMADEGTSGAPCSSGEPTTTTSNSTGTTLSREPGGWSRPTPPPSRAPSSRATSARVGR